MRAAALLLVALLGACASPPPTRPALRAAALEIAGDPYPASWALPKGEPAGLMLLEHGYARRCEHLRTTAQRLADAGLAVLCIDAPMSGGNPLLADALAPALAALAVLPDGRAVPRAIVVGGHSAGAAFAVRVAARLRAIAPQRLAGALLLDPVAVGGFSDQLRAVAERGARPVLAIEANASDCNAHLSARPALLQLRDEMIRAGRVGFVGVQLVDGSTHLDAEGEDSDWAAQLACGHPLPDNSARLRGLAAGWALAMARGEAPQPPADTAGLRAIE